MRRLDKYFFNSDEVYSDSETSESDSNDELPPNLQGLEKGDDAGLSAATRTQGDKSNLAEQVNSPRTATSNFTPPGPGITFDSSKSGMQTPSASATEVQCFKLFFTEELVGEIVEETNRYASELQEKMAPGVLGKMARWVTTTIKEMYLFLMAVLLMGVIKKTSLRHYWSTDPLLQTPFFGTLFSQDCFLLLLHCLHFTNSARVSHHDPLHKIRRVFTAITSSFRHVFVPYKDLCVDESLMKWKGRLAFRHYIPTKRSRFGVKFFILCDVLTGYVVIYTGSTTDICLYEGLGISGSVVMTLLAPYLGKGHVLYVDNWYSSPSLFQHLLSHGTGACGTVWANRTGMPVFTGKMAKGQVECRQNGTQLVVK